VQWSLIDQGEMKQVMLHRTHASIAAPACSIMTKNFVGST
jgi:hypothetical protein